MTDIDAIPEECVRTIPEFIELAEQLFADWGSEQRPWFRGESECFETPLLPKLFREPHNENALNQFFRARAAVLEGPQVPARPETDKWLFLARHVGLPTRLLDWTEGALIGLYFALGEKAPIVWALNPLVLNRKTDKGAVANMPIITWGKHQHINLRAAWEPRVSGLDLPIAIQPTEVHRRMSAQRSRFTIHGSRPESLNQLVGGECLTKIRIGIGKDEGFDQLLRLGISESTLFPDLEGLARELHDLY